MWTRLGMVAIAVLCVGVLGAWHMVAPHAAPDAKERILLVWPNFDGMAVEDKAVIIRASVLCRLTDAKSVTSLEAANCLLSGAQRDDEQGQHGPDNAATFKRLYRATVAATAPGANLTQAAR